MDFNRNCAFGTVGVPVSCRHVEERTGKEIN